jgi:type I restriction enzyme M protein
MAANYTVIEKRLWEAADALRANSKLKSSEYSVPVLGLIFLCYADYKFTRVEKELAAAQVGSCRRRTMGKLDYQARGVLYLPEAARFSNLLKLPEGADISKAINEAIKAIGEENPELDGVLPRNYSSFDNSLLVSLLKSLNFTQDLEGLEGDVFGKIYEYFLGEFARSEGQKGGEFFTPLALVKLIVEIIEPFHGRIFDPACGSGGMFVQSAALVEKRKKVDPNSEISLYGQERVAETLRLCKMNLAVHGLSGLGSIREGNSYYEDIHKCLGKFDFVMANPPFNVNAVDKEKMKADARFKELGLPKVDNANYIWIQLFYSALNETGRSGFVMANSASDARGSELEIRQKLIKSGAVDVMVAIGSNFFYTVTLPCTLWFLDRSKVKTARKEKVLFVDARHIYRQVDRAHRDFTDEQIELLANIVRLYRGELPQITNGSQVLLDEKFPNGAYQDVAGLCRVATLAEIEAQGWSLNPGRYVGVAERAIEDFDFAERLEELNEELEVLNLEARELEDQIAENVAKLLEQALG